MSGTLKKRNELIFFLFFSNCLILIFFFRKHIFVPADLRLAAVAAAIEAKNRDEMESDDEEEALVQIVPEVMQPIVL